MRSLPSPFHLASLLLLARSAQASLVSPPSTSNDQSNSTDTPNYSFQDPASHPNYLSTPGYSPYPSFPPSSAPIGTSFIPKDQQAPISPLLGDLHPRSDDDATNPLPRRRAPEWAWDRHPLYTPGKGDEEEQRSRFKTKEYNYTRTRERGLAWEQHQVGKRAVVSSVDIDFPPSACASSFFSLRRSPPQHVLTP